MTYHTICFYCRYTLKLRESIMVKQAIQSHNILHRYHPDCYAKLTEPVAQRWLQYDEIRKQMTNAQVQTPTDS